MSTTQSSTDSVAGMFGNLGQQNLARFTDGYERLVEGVMSAAIEQIELTQGLIVGGLADLELLTRAQTPTAFVEAEFEVMRRRSERIADATRKVIHVMNRRWIPTNQPGSPMQTSSMQSLPMQTSSLESPPMQAPPIEIPRMQAKPMPVRAGKR